MTIAAEAPRGGIVGTFGEQSYPLKLRLSEIERFEDKHRGIFDLWEALFGGEDLPTSKEVRDLLALGLVGGGLSDEKADRIIGAAEPSDLQMYLVLAQNLLGCAFLPDVGEEVGADEKKDEPRTGSTSGD